MNINDKEVKDLRAQFLKKLEESDSDIFHANDINRVKLDDKYLHRFILQNEGNQENAFTMLWETCEWRKKFNVNDINEKNVNLAILESGSVFSYGKDKDGKTLLIFKSKKHNKGAYDFEDQKRCLVYWMERLERQENGEMISLLFDMDGAVLGNMDMEYTKYLISLFKNYYPHFLNYIIIFEMAWVLSAVFKVIKSWLPPKAVEKMKFVHKSNIKDFVDPDFCLKSWGGKDNYVFCFEPEERTLAPPAGSGDENRKKVHFADGSFKKDQLNESGFEEASTPVSAGGLAVSPPDVMLFAQDGNEVTSHILLKNEDTQWLSYKIKTTSPEKFRVRPSAGVLGPGTSATISVVLLPGYLLQSLQRDKFLIMSIPIERSEGSQPEINELWKVNEKEIRQRRLRCSAPQVASNDFGIKNGSAFSSQNTDDQKMVARLCSDITKLNAYVRSLKEEMKLIRQQQWIIIFAVMLLLCSLAYAVFLSPSQPLDGVAWRVELSPLKVERQVRVPEKHKRVPFFFDGAYVTFERNFDKVFYSLDRGLAILFTINKD